MPQRFQAKLAQSLMSRVSSAMAQARSSSTMSRQVFYRRLVRDAFGVSAPAHSASGSCPT